MTLAFTMQQKIKVLSGAGSVNKLGELLSEAGFSKPFLIFDPGIKASGIAERVSGILKDAGAEVVEFDRVRADPPADMVEEAAAVCKANRCDCVIALGGGSAIDTGHGVTVLRFNEGHILDFADPAKEMKPSPGLISIPTTSGTGAEMSNGIIITNPATGEKVPIVGVNAMSEFAILDPELTLGMPASLTAMTGLDVFSHAMEAFTTVLSNPLTDMICEKVMQEVVENLPTAVREPQNFAARERMHNAASLGGWMLANCCAHVGHSIAHVLGGALHLPHGAACAFGAPAAMRFIAPAVPDKIKKVGEILGAEFTGNESPEEIAELTCRAFIRFRDESVGLAPMESFGVDKTAVLAQTDTLAEKVAAECFAPLSPRTVTEADAKKMLEEVFGATPERKMSAGHSTGAIAG